MLKREFLKLFACVPAFGALFRGKASVSDVQGGLVMPPEVAKEMGEFFRAHQAQCRSGEYVRVTDADLARWRGPDNWAGGITAYYV